MDVRACSHCGEYRYIEERGYCRECARLFLYEVEHVLLAAELRDSYRLDAVDDALREDDRFRTEEGGRDESVSTRVWVTDDSCIEFTSYSAPCNKFDVSWYSPTVNSGDAAIREVRRLFAAQLPEQLLDALSVSKLELKISFSGSVDMWERLAVRAKDEGLPVDVAGTSIWFENYSGVRGDFDISSPFSVVLCGPSRERVLSAWRDARMTELVLSTIDQST